jgi:AraC family transcriptional regulator
MPNDYERRLIRVLDHIFDHPSGDLSLDALADVAAMSRFHWHRVFHAMTGETTAQAVRRIRLHRAAMSLVHGARPVAAIAAEVGYPNLASFTRAFTDAYGMPPATFRKRGEPRPTTPRFRTGVPLMFPVDVQTRPAMRLAALPHRGEYNAIGRAFDKLTSIFAARGLFPKVRGMVGVYYCNPNETPAAELKSHAGFAVDEDFPIEAPLEEVRLAPGRHAVLHHRGPYTGLAAAYDQLFCTWLPQSGEEAGDAPAHEVYLNTPADTKPEDLLTEICLPLA